MSRNTGLKNERALCSALNGKTLNTIEQSHLRAFIQEIFDYKIKSHDIITCTMTPKQVVNINGKPKKIDVKQDIMITVNNRKKRISVKEGSGNSVHEESIYNFISFLKELGADQGVIDSLLLFQWGDGTLNNTGNVRLKGKEVKDTYRREMEIVHNFFNEHRVSIIKRVLSKGAYEDSGSQVDYIYHGDLSDGVWCSIEYAIAVNNQTENTKEPIAVGFLSFQNQNRNTTENPNKKKARQQIQFKWGNMAAILEKGMSLRSRINKPIKQLGNNKHGFENVATINHALNGEKIGHLKPNLKKFITYLFPTSPQTAIVTSERIKGTEKGSLDITVGKQTIRVLIKSGGGNSVHQEAYEEFYRFLREQFNTPTDIIDAFKRLQWGDGTLDGTGPRDEWLKANEIKKAYTREVEICNNYINQKPIAEILLKRFLLTGKHKAVRTNEYVYFGNMESAYWAKTEDIITHQLNVPPNKRALLSIGNFNLQSWGRTIKKFTNQDQREALQVKATRLEEDIIAISKSVGKKSYYQQGEDSERSFVQKYNSDPSIFKEDLSIQVTSGFTYAVQVKGSKYSSLTESKVNPKSDAYLIHTAQPLNEQLLYENNFYLSEDDIQGVDYKIINESGVSIKREDSNKFTYAKFSKTAFEKLFNGQTELFVGALMYLKDKEMNDKILEDNHLTLTEILDKFGLEEKEDALQSFKEIKAYSNNRIHEMIKSNIEIYQAVFFGMPIFEEPYCATYLYTSKLEHKNDLTNLPFTVTTGSGRSNGKYTIIIKPK